MRHLRVWFAAAPPGGPPGSPAGYYGPAWVRAPWNAKAGKAAGAPTGAVSFLLPRLLGAPTPSLGEGTKRRALPRPTQVRDQHSGGYALHSFKSMRARCTRRSTVLSPFVPAQAGTQTFEKPVCLALGSRLRGDERSKAAAPRFASKQFFRITACYEQ